MPLLSGGEGAALRQRRRVVADVNERRRAVRVLARHEVVDEIARPPDLEGVEPVLAVVGNVGVDSVVVRGEKRQHAAGRVGIRRGRLRLQHRPVGGVGYRIVLGRDRVFRRRGNREVRRDQGNGVPGGHVVIAKLLVVIDIEQCPGINLRAIAARTPDRLARIEHVRRPLDHRLDLVDVRLRRVVGDEAPVASALDILDLGISGRHRPRRERNCRGHCRESPNNAIREFLHVTAPFHFIAPLVHSKPCQSPMSKVQAATAGPRTLDVGRRI